MRMRWAVIFLVSMSLLPSQLFAQSYADLVWDQLKRAYRAAEESGFSVRNYILGKLDDDETDTWTIHLNGGNQYAIVGACDGDCQDIDLQILNASGDEVASDYSEDDLPTVAISPRSSGRYSIKVNMYKCTANPCYFGIALFYK